MDSTIKITDVAELQIPCCGKKIEGQKCCFHHDLDNSTKQLRKVGVGNPEEVTSEGWENLPLLVFRVLFRYIDYRTKLQVRQVCSKWLDIMEFEVDLRVDAYESDRDNTRFINSVRVKELHIKECFVPQVKGLMRPSEVEVLGLYGNTCPHWFTMNMRNDFALIKRLILRGKAVSYLELGRILVNDMNLFNTNSTGTLPSLVFENLEQLDIIADSCSFPLNDSFFTNRSVLSPMNQNIIRTIAADISQNICYFLNNIRSKRLKAAKIYSYQVNVPENVNWKSNPLKRFLGFHADSLEILLLPGFSGENENSYSLRNNNGVPTSLKTLKMHLSSYLTRNRFGGVQNPIFWLKLILYQHNLENLNLELVCFPYNFMTSLMYSIVSKNFITLKRIELTYVPSEWSVVNGNIFSPCKLLESLTILKHIEARPICVDRSRFINLVGLPSSLIKLELTGFLIDTNFIAVSKFSKLQHVVLQIVIADSALRYQRNVNMIANFLNLRHLNYFDFYIAKPPPPKFLPLTKIKTFVYKTRLFKEHILNTNYISSLSIDYGIQVLITEEIACIRYAPSVCRMYNPESVVEVELDDSLFDPIDELLAVENIAEIEVPDDAHLITLVQQDLGLLGN